MICNDNLSQRHALFHSFQFISVQVTIAAQFYYLSCYIIFLAYTRQHRERYCQTGGLQGQKSPPSDFFPSIKFSGIHSCFMLS